MRSHMLNCRVQIVLDWKKAYFVMTQTPVLDIEIGFLIQISDLVNQNVEIQRSSSKYKLNFILNLSIVFSVHSLIPFF